jgi:hypothetical protein
MAKMRGSKLKVAAQTAAPPPPALKDAAILNH